MTAKEIVLEFPREFVEKNVGLGIDIGGSSIKFVYRHQDEWNDLQNNKELRLGRMRMRTCAREGLDDMVKHLKDNCHITRDSDGSATVGVTGVGGMQFGNILSTELNVNLGTQLEFDCFVKAFNYVHKNYPRRNIVTPPCQKIYDERNEKHKKAAEMYAKFQDFTAVKQTTDLGAQENMLLYKADDQILRDTIKPLSEAEDMFPCMMAMCGSGFAWFKVTEDGKSKIIDGSNRGGRMFLGLGSLLTDAQTFEELVDLASKGNSFKVSTTTKSLKEEQSGMESNEADAYSMMMDDMDDVLVFCFGQAVNKDKDSFAKEDLAAALLELICLDVTQTVLQASRLEGIKQVFFCGGFPTAPFVQETITRIWCEKESENKLLIGKGDLVKLNFLPHGQFLGALGSIIT